jgi:hypothetical protein
MIFDIQGDDYASWMVEVRGYRLEDRGWKKNI